MQGGSRRKSTEIAADRPEPPRVFEGTTATSSGRSKADHRGRSVAQVRWTETDGSGRPIRGGVRSGPGSPVFIRGRSALLDPLADYRDDTARQRVREEFAERHLRPVAGGRRGQLLIKVAVGRIAGSDEGAAAGIRRRSRLSDEILPRLTSHKIERSSITVTAEAVEIEDLLNPGEGDGVGASIGADRGAGICRQVAIGGARVNRTSGLSAATRDEPQKKSRVPSTRHRV
jgi:hypothetical protein